ncbi:MAG: hypothetical protein WC875_05425 [Candidatus Absconditabacterales bacterium]|jgi:hypothetical protein
MTENTDQKSYITMSREYSQYLPEIEECFQDLDIPVKAGLTRKSIGEFPMEILIFVGSSIASGIIYDLLKIGIKRIYQKFKDAHITVRDSKAIMFSLYEDETVNTIVAPDRKKEFAHIKTIDDLIIYLQETSKKEDK